VILPFSNQISSGKELMSHRARAVGCIKEKPMQIVDKEGSEDRTEEK